jgi:hypothetical protein
MADLGGTSMVASGSAALLHASWGIHHEVPASTPRYHAI